MKKIYLILIVFLCLCINNVWAQIPSSGGPDGYGYTWLTSDDASPNAPNYNWIDITSSGTLLTGVGDDYVTTPINIGFNFPFYWYTVNQFAIGSNGYIQFESTPFNISSDNYGPGGDESFPEFPYDDPQGDANNLLAPMLTDLNPTSANGASIYYYSNNTDTLIVSYINAGFWSTGTASSGSNTFQVILCASDSSITFQYANQSGSWASSYDANPNPIVIGIESSGGLEGLTVTDITKPSANLAIRFEVAPNPSFTFEDVNMLYHQNTRNSGTFAIVGEGSDISVGYKNIGNADISSNMNITTKIEKFNAGSLASTNIFSAGATGFIQPGLAAGQSQTYTYPTQLTPLNSLNQGEPGSYRITSTSSYGDQNSSNNSVETELQIVEYGANDELRLGFFDSTVTSYGQFGFTGGAVYFPNPLPWIEIETIQMHFVTDGTQASGGMKIRIHDNDGNGGVGPAIDSGYISNTAINYTTSVGVPAPATYYNFTTPILYNGSGFFVVFISDLPVATANYGVLTDLALPFSNNNFETQDNVVFATYRENTLEDIMLGVHVKKYAQCNQSAQLNPRGVVEICEGEQLTVNTGNYTGYNYNWKTNGVDTTYSNPQSITINSPGTYVLSIDSNGTCSSSDSVVVNVVQGPVVDIQNTPPLNGCAGDTIQLNASLSNYTSFHWSLNGTTIAGVTDSSYSVTSGGTYKITATNSSLGCSISDSVKVTINAIPNPTIVQNGSVLTTTTSYSTYQWYRDFSPLTGAINSTLTFPGNGVYSVEVADGIGCTGFSNQYQVLNFGLKDEMKDFVKIYPNPAQNSLFMETLLPVHGEMSYELMDLNGRIIKSIHTTQSMVQMDLQDVNNGFYMVHILSQNEHQYIKLLIGK